MRKLIDSEEIKLRTFIINYKDKFDYLSIRYEKSFYTTINKSPFEEPEITTSSEKGYAVSLLNNDKPYYISSNRIENICNRIEAKFHFNQNSKKTSTTDLKTLKNPELERLEDFHEVSQLDKLNLISRFSRFADEEGILLSSISYYDRAKYIIFLDSEDKIFNQIQTNSAFYSEVSLNENNCDFIIPLSIANYEGIIQLTTLESELGSIKEILIYYQEHASPIPYGTYDVLLSPDLSGVFIHETIGHLSEADTFHNNIVELGTNVSQTELSVYDVPLECEGFDFDEEGSPSKSTTIIENGNFINLLHSKITSTEAYTGNGRSISYRFPPITRMKQTLIQSGSYSTLELQKMLNDGLYLVGYRGGNTFEEFFNLKSVYGYYVQNGKLTNIFNSVEIYGEIKSALKKIIGIGEKTQLIRDAGGCDKQGQNNLPNEMRSPSLLIKNLKIGDCLEYED